MAGTAVLLIAHGSSVPEANEDLVRVAEALRGRGLCDSVEVSYLDRASPTIQEGIDACVRGGSERVLLVPYFLSLGGHVRRDLPRQAREGERRHPGITIELSEPLGFDTRLVDLVADRVAEGLRAHGWPVPERDRPIA